MSKITKNLKSQNLTVFMLNALALLVAAQNVNAACAWLQHQPEVPEEAKRFRKF